METLAEQQALAEQYPDWKVWRSQGSGERPGELMATRRRNLTRDELEAGLHQSLPMGAFGNLAEQLREEAERERRLGGDDQ